MNFTFIELAEELMDAIFVFKSDLEVVFINDSCERLFNLSKSKLKLQKLKMNQIFLDFDLDFIKKYNQKFSNAKLSTSDGNDFEFLVKFSHHSDLTLMIAKESEFEGHMLDKYKKSMNELKAINTNLEKVILAKTDSLNQQQALLELILKNTPIGLVSFNKKGQIQTGASQFYLNIFGAGDNILKQLKGIDASFVENFKLWLDQIDNDEVDLIDLMELAPSMFILNGINYKTFFYSLSQDLFLMTFFKDNQNLNDQIVESGQRKDLDLFLILFPVMMSNCRLEMKDCQDFQQILNFLRNLHSLKGIFHLFGFNDEVTIIHKIEDRFSSFVKLKQLPSVKFMDGVSDDLNALDQKILLEINNINKKSEFSISLHQIFLYVKELKPNEQKELGLALFSKNLNEFSSILSHFFEKVCLQENIDFMPMNLTNLKYKIPVWTWIKLLPVFSAILRNAISHALDYKNGIQVRPLEVSIDIYEKNKEIIIDVKDNGRGFPDEILVSDKIANTLSGRGLGINGIHRELENLKGTLQCLNLEQGGASYHMTFDSLGFFSV